MLISEVSIKTDLRQGIQNNLNKDLYKWMVNQGWEYVGSGYYASCWTKPDKNYVMKINTAKDRGYEYFIDVRKTLKSKYLPRILSTSYISKSNKKYYIYLIEKLEVLNNPSLAKAVYHLSSELQNNNFTDFTRKDKAILDKYPGLENLINKLFALKIKTHGLDLHDANIMKRADGTPVITDPYAPPPRP